MKGVPTGERLLEILAAMEGRVVPMVVDLVADRFVTGVPKRISREAPVLILRFEDEQLVPGGGANAVANVAALGGRPLPVGVVGDDACGADLRRAIAAMGVDTGGILLRRGYRTPTKTRILGGGRHSIKQQIVRYDIEDQVDLEPRDLDAFRAALEPWAGRCRAAVISDYGYGAAAPPVAGLLRGALGGDCALLCDSRFRLGDFRDIDGATPNEEEAEALLGGTFGDDPERLRRRGEELRQRLGVRFLLITRGSYGMALFSGGGVVRIPVHGTDEVADVTGAGDTVIGTFALALAAGASPVESALLANYAGGVVVMKRGTATLTAEELATAVRRDPVPREELAWAST